MDSPADPDPRDPREPQDSPECPVSWADPEDRDSPETGATMADPDREDGEDISYSLSACGAMFTNRRQSKFRHRATKRSVIMSHFRPGDHGPDGESGAPGGCDHCPPPRTAPGY